jgi:hypothetical protein
VARKKERVLKNGHAHGVYGGLGHGEGWGSGLGNGGGGEDKRGTGKTPCLRRSFYRVV